MLNQEVVVTGWSYHDNYYLERKGVVTDVEDHDLVFPIEVTFHDDEIPVHGFKKDFFKSKHVKLVTKEGQK